MTKRNVLSGLVDSIYEGVAVAAESAVVFGDVVDKAGRAVQDGIEHLQDVWPEWFTKEDEEEESGYLFQPDEASKWKIDEWDKTAVRDEPEAPVERELSREDKIEAIQHYVWNAGFRDSIWHTNPVGIAENIVNVTYDTLIRLERNGR